MKTDELIGLLAASAGAVPAHATRRRFANALGVGMLGALGVMLTLLHVRADLLATAALPAFWLKIGFVASVMAASLFSAVRLSQPGARTHRIPAALLGPLVVMWPLAAHTLSVAAPEQRLELFLGSTWRTCPLLIAVLSVPAFIATMWAMRGLAPTRPRFAGFAAGLLAGATAALAYSLHCPEMTTPFVGFWYLLGMLIPALAGYALGDSLLRW